VRHLIAVFAAVAMVGSAPSASAGPICETRGGESVRCEDPRAMPLGWTLPLDERFKHPDAGPPEPTTLELSGVITLIFLFFALIALMPDFDGWTAGGSDKDDDDGEGLD
jgi:hypothetical protein